MVCAIVICVVNGLAGSGWVCNMKISGFSGRIDVWENLPTANHGLCPVYGSSVYNWPKNANGPTIGQGLFDDQDD